VGTLINTKAALSTIGHAKLALSAIRYLRQGALRILMYHNFPADMSLLELQCQHIVSHYSPVSLSEVVARKKNWKQTSPNALAVTVDDGYRDFYLYGYPVFRKYRIPVTVYLVSDFVDQKFWLWWNRLDYVFEHAAVSSVTFKLPGGDFDSGPLENRAKRLRAAALLCERLKALSNRDRLRSLDYITKRLNVCIPETPSPEWQAMNWEEVREAARNGITFGSHTKTHPILSKIEDSEQIRDEIEVSKRRIEQELQQPCIHFCYPNGRMSDIGPAALEWIKKMGFVTAVTTERGLNYSKQDPFLLRRLGIGPQYPLPYFMALLAGLKKT